MARFFLWKFLPAGNAAPRSAVGYAWSAAAKLPPWNCSGGGIHPDLTGTPPRAVKAALRRHVAR